MSRKIWHLDVGDEKHVVDLQWNRLTLSGKVTVDGEFIKGWSAVWKPWDVKSKHVKFDVAGKPAILRFIINSDSPNKQELYVDDILIKESK